ncbi:MAG: HIT family protein [Hyphomicrobiaceae bacterium]
MASCIFCEIISRERPADILAENDDVMVWLSLEHHPIVVPKLHVPDLFGLSDVLGAVLMRETVRVARAVRTGLHCDGIYVTQTNGEAAGQSVFHLHLHVYPRWLPGSPNRINLSARIDRPARQALAEAIKRVLDGD